jgi:cell division protein ZapA
MNRKNDVAVIINNKKYVISGFESDEYMQKIASYINGKYAQFRLSDGFRHLDPDMKNVLLQINIADDYFKAKRQINDYENESEHKSNEIFDMKHELISMQTKNEALSKELAVAKDDFVQAQKKIIRLEEELKEYNKKISKLKEQ